MVLFLFSYCVCLRAFYFSVLINCIISKKTSRSRCIPDVRSVIVQVYFWHVTLWSSSLNTEMNCFVVILLYCHPNGSKMLNLTNTNYSIILHLKRELRMIITSLLLADFKCTVLSYFAVYCYLQEKGVLCDHFPPCKTLCLHILQYNLQWEKLLFSKETIISVLAHSEKSLLLLMAYFYTTFIHCLGFRVEIVYTQCECPSKRFSP